MRPTASWLKRVLQPAIHRSRHLPGDEGGATAVEFAILALPFFTVVFAILETAIVFLAGQILDSAVNDASRDIRTRQAQTAGWTEADFRTAVCSRLYGMFDCADTDKLRIKVSVISNFAAANPTPPITCNPTCTWTLTQSYQPGQASSVVIVEAYYKWPTVIDTPWFDLASMPDGTRLLSAVRLFRNEP